MYTCTLFRKTYRRVSSSLHAYKDSQTAARICSGILTGYYGIASAHYLSGYIGDLSGLNKHEQTAADLGLGLLGFLVGYVLGSFACKVAGKVAEATPLSRLMPRSQPLLPESLLDSSNDGKSDNVRLARMEKTLSSIDSRLQSLVGMRFTSVELLRQEFETLKGSLNVSGSSLSSDDSSESSRTEVSLWTKP